MKMKKLTAMTIAAILGVTMLAGCGGFTGSKDSAAKKEETASGSAVASGSMETAEPSGEVLSVATNAEIKTLVPWAASENQAFLVLNQAQEGLYRMDADNVPQPALAESVNLSEDKLTYTFHLREGLTWSNGDPITAADFVYSWLKQMSPDATNGYGFIMTDYIVGGAEYNEGSGQADGVAVKAVDDKTLEVKIKSPTPYFLNLTTMSMFFPVNQKFAEAQGDQYSVKPDTMIYAGPYVITEYDPAVGVTFQKNDKYWDAANVKITDAKVRVMKDAAASLNAYKAGELTQVSLTATDVAANKDNPEFAQGVDFRTNYLQFNLTDPVMGNVNMRRAISLSIDRETLVNTILADGSAAGTGLIADGMAGDGSKTFRELNGQTSPFDAEKAKEYYEKAKEELGANAPSEITLLIGDDSVMKTVATFIQSEISKNLGLDVVIDTKTMQGRGEQMDANNYQFGFTAWGADYDDAMTYLDLWTNGSPYRGNYKNDTYNNLIADAKAQTDDAARLKDMLEAEKLLITEDAVVAPIYHRGHATLTKSNIKNLITHPIGVPMEFKYASFE